MSPDSGSQFSAHITSQSPFPAALTGWKMFLKDQGRSQHTIKAFAADLQLLVNYLPPDRTVGAVSSEDINSFLAWLQNKRGVPCSPKSLARRVTAIKSFYRWLHKAGVLAMDPAEKVLQQSVISPLPEVLTPAEVDAVLKAAAELRTAKKPDARPYTLVLLLLTTGIKKGECLAISPNHLDFDAASGPLLFVRYASPQNRYKERKIPLTPEWVEAYDEYAAQYRPADRVFEWSPRRLEYLLEDLGVAAGLKKHLSFDMCRWTCALADYKAGMEKETLRQKLGISKIQWREIGRKLQSLAG